MTTLVGVILLGTVAVRAPVLEAACDPCDRHGRQRTDRLLAEHRPAMPMPELRRVIAADCARMIAGRAHDVCGVKFPQWLGWALAFRGRALAARGQAQEAFTLLTQALAQLRAIGVANGLPRLLASLANVCATLGRPAEAWDYLAEAARLIEATDERSMKLRCCMRCRATC